MFSNQFAMPQFATLQFPSAAKEAAEAQLAMITDLTNKMLEGVGKIAELNMATAKEVAEDALSASMQLVSTTNPQDFFAMATAQAQPNADKAVAYGRQLATIASGLQSELSRAAESQMAIASRKAADLVDSVAKNAPAGSENVISMFKTAMDSASAGYEQFTKTAKQASDTIEANIAAATEQVTKTVEKTARARK